MNPSPIHSLSSKLRWGRKLQGREIFLLTGLLLILAGYSLETWVINPTFTHFSAQKHALYRSQSRLERSRMLLANQEQIETLYETATTADSDRPAMLPTRVAAIRLATDTAAYGVELLGASPRAMRTDDRSMVRVEIDASGDLKSIIKYLEAVLANNGTSLVALSMWPAGSQNDRTKSLRLRTTLDVQYRHE